MAHAVKVRLEPRVARVGAADRPRRRRGCDAALHLWTSQPAPVQERRRRLLQLMGLAGAGFETGRSASQDAAGPPPASPVSRSRSGGAARGSAGKPPLGAGRLRSSLSDGSDAADEDPRCLIKNLDDGREYVVREEFGLREVGTGRHITVEESASARRTSASASARRTSASASSGHVRVGVELGAGDPSEDGKKRLVSSQR